MTKEPNETATPAPGAGTPPGTVSKVEAAKALRRLGFTAAQVDELFSRLDDPIDLDRDGELLQRHGITRGHLIDLMGGSP